VPRAVAFFALALLLPVCVRAADAPSFVPKSGESAQAFALRAAGAPAGDDTHVTSATWNGQAFAFVDYMVTGPIPGSSDTEQDRKIVALAKMPDGSYRRMDVTTGEEEGGPATVEAIGFANADRDPAQELVVLLSWPVQHADVDGTLYEVRIFDDVGAAPPPQLSYLKSVSEHFGKDSCDCDRGDGKPEHYRFRTMAAIKRELAKMKF
jgi:hypothetical protein